MRRESPNRLIGDRGLKDSSVSAQACLLPSGSRFSSILCVISLDRNDAVMTADSGFTLLTDIEAHPQTM